MVAMLPEAWLRPLENQKGDDEHEELQKVFFFFCYTINGDDID
jgi:hypothetical protein